MLASSGFAWLLVRLECELVDEDVLDGDSKGTWFARMGLRELFEALEADFVGSSDDEVEEDGGETGCWPFCCM